MCHIFLTKLRYVKTKRQISLTKNGTPGSSNVTFLLCILFNNKKKLSFLNRDPAFAAITSLESKFRVADGTQSWINRQSIRKYQTSELEFSERNPVQMLPITFSTERRDLSFIPTFVRLEKKRKDATNYLRKIDQRN